MPQTLNFPTPPPFIIIHGGAWDIPSPLMDLSVVGVEIAAREGLTILLNGGTGERRLALVCLKMIDSQKDTNSNPASLKKLLTQ